VTTNDRPGVHELDRAEVALEREYGVPSFVIAERDAPEHVPPDVLTWWRAADARRRELIRSTPRGPLYVTNDIEPIDLRRKRLKKPVPPR
jgi:hypothetical protein